MHQQPVSTYSLHVYDVDLGLWEEMTLGSPVLPLSVEAMNAILIKDGILAYIGPRSGFGSYLTDLEKDRETAIPRCWTSLPAVTVMSKLGLCQNTQIAGKPEVVFYGSPLTVTVTRLNQLKDEGFLDWFLAHARSEFKSGVKAVDMFYTDTSFTSLHSFNLVSHAELEDALTYIKG
jgi:hypothetical protein